MHAVVVGLVKVVEVVSGCPVRFVVMNSAGSVRVLVPAPATVVVSGCPVRLVMPVFVLVGPVKVELGRGVVVVVRVEVVFVVVGGDEPVVVKGRVDRGGVVADAEVAVLELVPEAVLEDVAGAVEAEVVAWLVLA